MTSDSSRSGPITGDENKSEVPYRQIRAVYDKDTITVYQAYQESIATAAVREQKLNASADFRFNRMTWIKPSWCWMMYGITLPNLIVSIDHPNDSFNHFPESIIFWSANLHALPFYSNRYRSGYAQKDIRQTHILALKIKHKNFEKILRHAAICNGKQPFSNEEREKLVRVQWDPERSWRIGQLPYRSIQIGICRGREYHSSRTPALFLSRSRIYKGYFS